MSIQLKAGLWQHQSLKLAMTQQLTQAITLLQYSTQELKEFLEAKTMENPFLQLETRESSDKVHHSNYSVNRTQQDHHWIEHIAVQSNTLLDHLRLQLSHLRSTAKERKILNYLFYNLDENGYLKISVSEASSVLSCREKDIEEMIQLIQQLEPAGVGAENLQRCLMLQIERDPNAPALAKELILAHFIEFADKKWTRLAKKLQIEVKDIQMVADYIQTLNPKPGAAFNSEKPQYVTPDMYVQIQDHEIKVQLLDDELPKIIFHDHYYEELSQLEDQQVIQFLKEKQQDYEWLIKSLDQRKQTILKVGLLIVKKQKPYFLKGPTHLLPLTMREIADELGVHESTVSRSVRGKYMQTPYGTVELKTFFSNRIPSSEREENRSTQQVKNQLSIIIKQEDKLKPLSDQEICNRLQKEGFIVSRRTVAKYREQLGIPSSTKRKRYA